VKGDVQQLALTNEVLNVALDGAELTRRLLTFARKQILTPGPVDLRQYLPSLVALIRRTLGEAIRIATVTADDLWLVRADQAQVGEALLNLVVNARDAMPYGGELTIAASNVQLDDEYAMQNAEVLPGDYVMLSVTDTGTGMPPEVVERAMEPFFTTKTDATGTGLGLSMVFGFAKQSGGHLRIYSEVGLGTTVRLYLPRTVDQQIDAPAAPPAIPDMQAGTASVLVVDDNAAMADVARRHLTALGYSVTVALGGPAALLLLESSTPFDLLFTDVVMPDGLTGYDLAETALKLRPGMRVLFTTGYGGGLNGHSNQLNDEPRSPVLRKPYRRQELAALVRTVLDGSVERRIELN
jgi:CheY-like chemotaxis protein